MPKLTAKFVHEAAKPGRYHDGDAGLFLTIKPSGAKSYIQRLVIQGRRRDIGLGSTKWVTLTEARRAARANRDVARLGGDPLAEKTKPVPTFAAAVETVIALHAGAWVDNRSEVQWRASLRDYAMPRLGAKLVSEVTTADVLAVLTPIWSTKYETAKRVRNRIGAVMKWAIAEGHRQDNPAGDALGAVLPRVKRIVQHHTALPYAEVAAALDRVRQSDAFPGTKAAFEFLVLTAARTGEIRGATWDEIDREAAVWTIPAGRMKMKREHRVPLSAAALRVLDDAAQRPDGSGLVFSSSRAGDRGVSRRTLGALLTNLAIDSTVHGFRTSFRVWASEQTNAPHAVMELSLAHNVGSAVERAYARSDLLDKRRGLMEQWAQYLAGAGANVIPLRRASG